MATSIGVRLTYRARRGSKQNKALTTYKNFIPSRLLKTIKVSGAWFDPNSRATHLIIRNVAVEDETSYRCKVHFWKSPFWLQRINLSVKSKFDPKSTVKLT